MRWCSAFLILGCALSLEARAEEPAVLEGPVMYPGCSLPEDLRVCAQAVGATTPVCVAATPGDQGPRYRLVVPAGRYKVFASTGVRRGYRAYFSQAVVCGLEERCKDHAPVVVQAVAGRTVTGAAPADWFAPEHPEPLASL